MIGKTLGHYQITHKLGAGGMGVVYRARDTKLGREVALKLLPTELLADPAAQSRLLEEARMASALNHPNICTIYEVGKDGDVTFAAMEYVEGRSLRAVVPSEGLPIELLIRYGAQIADAVSYAHEHGVIHRDIKTSNMMVTPDGRVKVLDFGLARRAASEAEQVTRSQVPGSAAAVAGTLHYLAPEVLRGETADARSDIWAMGVVLYEMASGQLPYDATSGYELTSKILRDPLPPLAQRVPAGLRAIIQRCLSREPGQRYQRAGEVRAALEAIGSSDPAIAQAVQATATEQPQSRGPLWILGSVALLLLVLVGWLAWRGRAVQTGATGTAGSASAGGGARTSTGAKPSANAEANEFFEKGMYFLATQIDIRKGRQMFERAVQIDPKFAEARGWYGFSLLLEVDAGYSNDPVWIYRAEEQIRQTLSDDPQNGHAHTALGGLHFYRGNKELMKAELDQALAINPDDFDAHLWLGMNYYGWMSDYATAKRILRTLAERHPLMTVVRANLGEILRDEGDIPGSIREFEKVREQDPQNLFLAGLARTYLHGGDLLAARKVLEGIRPSDQKGFPFRLLTAILLAREGKIAAAEREMDGEALKFAALCPWYTTYVTEYYAVLGKPEKALEWLDRSVRSGDERAEFFQHNPLLASLREHPRFKQIIESVKYQRQQRQKKSP